MICEVFLADDNETIKFSLVVEGDDVHDCMHKAAIVFENDPLISDERQYAMYSCEIVTVH